LRLWWSLKTVRTKIPPSSRWWRWKTPTATISVLFITLVGLPQYVIDGNGRVFSLNFGNVADEQYHYDDNNELTNRVFADRSTNLMERDGLGRLLSHTDALGQHTEYPYDAK